MHNAYTCFPFVSLFHYSAISAFVITPLLFVISLGYLFLLSKTVLINMFEVFCGQEPSRLRFVRREDLSVRSPQLIVYHCNTFHLGRNAAGKSHGSPKMFSTSVMRGEI